MKKKATPMISAMMMIAIVTSCSSNQQTSSAQRGNRQGEPPSVDQLFEQMDTDNNGKLTLKEVKGPLRNDFSKIDANDDGGITKEELENAPRPNRRGGQGGGQRRGQK